MLPTFFVIGAYKCGTTSLQQYLSQHPQVFVPQKKEPSYFAFAGTGQAANSPVYRNSVKSLAEYESLFRDATPYVAVGDVSPEYMTSSRAAPIIRQSVPSARLVAILRNPVERAYSDFLMYRRDGIEKTTDFAAAIEMQAERAIRGDPTGFYISTGYYGEQLERYYDQFPAAQVKIFLTEELQTNGPRTMSQIFTFLGVEPSFVPSNLTVYNRSGIAPNRIVGTLFEFRHVVAPIASRIVPDAVRAKIRRKLEESLKRPALETKVRRLLQDMYRADVQLLEHLTGKSCGHWLS